MTVANENYRDDYVGNDVTTEFAVTFKFLINSDVKVVLYNSVTEVEIELTEVTHYTLTGAGVATGGTLTMVVTPTSDETLTFIRDLTFLQETDYVEHSTFPAESHETALDRLTMITQQLHEILDRTLRQSITQSGELNLPVPIADYFLRWTAEGNLENYDIADLDVYNVSSFMATMLDDITAEAAKNTLKIATGLYSLSQSTPVATFRIESGILFFGTTKVEYAGNVSINLGTGGAFETTALTADYYNKVLFTLNSSGILEVTEGTEAVTVGAVVEPAIPQNKFPICLITIQDNGNAGAGTILGIEQNKITQLQGSNRILEMLDEDDMASDSTTKTASQQSIKAYAESIKTYADTELALKLVKASNLSDVANVATARGNLNGAKSGANSDVTSLTGLTTPLTKAQGGSGTAGDSIVKAWINFNGTGTIAIRDSFNVTSITDNGAGDYTVTWDTDFANDDYGCVAMSNSTDRLAYILSMLTGSVRIGLLNLNLDASIMCVIAIGDQ